MERVIYGPGQAIEYIEFVRAGDLPDCLLYTSDPLTTNLVVADRGRTDKTICLAVTPSLKAHGIPGRPRLFAVVQKVREANARRLAAVPGGEFSGTSSDARELAAHPELAIDYIVAPPRMAYYMEYSMKVYDIYPVSYTHLMEARGGLVQHVDGFSGSAAAQLGGQLDSLGLAAGQGRGRLSQADVGEANVVQCLDLPVDGLHILEEMQRFLHRHVEHIVDAFSFVFDLQRLTVVAFAAADLAGHIDVGEEVHLDLDDAVAAAGLAASAFFVEAEASLVVALSLIHI